MDLIEFNIMVDKFRHSRIGTINLEEFFMLNSYKRKKILLITRGKKNSKILTQQLEELFGDQVDIIGHCVEEYGPPYLYDSDLILLSTESILNYIPADIKSKHKNKIVIAGRTIDFKNLYKLFTVPSNRKIMLVNDRKETAEEVISLLYNMGFNHLWLIPIYPDHPNPPRVDIAITPGESQLVPSYVSEIYDIGTRIIDLSTLMEILFRFDLLDSKPNILSAKYVSNIIDISRKLSESLNSNEKLNHLLEAIIQKINNGVIATDESGKIAICNRIAEELFGLNKEYVIGRNADDIVPNLEVNKPLLTGESDEYIEKTINNKHILLNRIPLEINNKISGSVLTCYEFDEVEKLEKKLRRHVYFKGHVSKYTFENIHGNSEKLQQQIKNAKKFAPLDTTVLITGETGTGKELMAHAIHNSSLRSKGPFVAINCAALPRDLLESELFGFEEGTFTGAKKGGRAGLFEQAHQGTIFLDEIGEIPAEIQVKLLRVLESKEVMRIGGDKLIAVDVRVIAATNRDLKEMVLKHNFREDLYYRLNVLKVYIPPLRDRKEDLLYLLDMMLKEYGKCVKGFLSDEAIQILQNYKWPGNIRELKNVVEFLVATVDEDRVCKNDLPQDLLDVTSSFQDGFTISTIDAREYKPYIKEDLAILKLLTYFAQNGQSLGRRRLLELMEKDGVDTTEDKIRTRLKVLENNGLIKILKGRAGSTITEKGKTLINTITHNINTTN